MLEGAYKKLKSYFYYDKTMLFMKSKISEFESDEPQFQSRLKSLGMAIFSMDNAFFEDLISKITYQLTVKSMISINSCDVPTEPDHNKKIGKLNFYIDAPIELHILDTLWMLFISKISSPELMNNKHSFALRFRKSLFINDDSLKNGIDFKSNRCFVPYYKNYSLWQNSALETIRSNKDVCLISLDLKSFYYSIQFSFNEFLNKRFSNDYRYNDFAFITQQIEKMYSYYTSLLSSVRKDVHKTHNKNNTNILPIGLLSSQLLSEIYMIDFDNQLISALNPLHYGRYVDDILIVTKDKLIPNKECDYLSEKGLVSRSKLSSDLYNFCQYPNLSIQQEKVMLYQFSDTEDSVLLKTIQEQIAKCSSEANLMPDFSIIQTGVNHFAYSFGAISSTKIRSLGLLQSNNYAVTRYITTLMLLIKTTKITKDETNKLTDVIKDILYFYSGSAAIEYMSIWPSLFELFKLIEISTSDDERPLQYYRGFTRNFYYNVDDQIKKMDFKNLLKNDNIYTRKISCVLKKLKNDLRKRLLISISMAAAVKYVSGNSSMIKEVNFIAGQFRHANMFHHFLVFFPLINYASWSCINSVGSLATFDNDNLFHMMQSSLDPFRLKWSPRYIHLDELYIFFFLSNAYCETKNAKPITAKKVNDINDKYHVLNNLSFHSSQINTSESVFGDENVFLNYLELNNCDNNPYRIGLANVKTTEDDAFSCLNQPGYKTSISDKENVYKLLNTAITERANIVSFPEFFIPLVWLSEIVRFSRKSSIAVISGLRYICNKKRAFNFIVTIQPFKVGSFSNVLVLYREKNFYAPAEKLRLSQLGYIVEDHMPPVYSIIKYGSVAYSVFLCYEFVDIYSRAAMKAKIDLFFIPQFNKDTRYFSSIVESTARDLHCFVIQANTSIYGDSRITGPYNTDNKNIVQVKGGNNDLLIIGEVNIRDVQQFRKTDPICQASNIHTCFNCRKTKNKPLDVLNKCKGCKKLKQESRDKNIKGMPPNYK